MREPGGLPPPSLRVALRSFWLRLRYGAPPKAPPPSASGSHVAWATLCSLDSTHLCCALALLLALFLLAGTVACGGSSDEEEEEGEPTHHDASQEHQANAARHEEAAMAAAPREEALWRRPAADGSEELASEGLVCLEGALSEGVARALLTHVNTTLASELQPPAAAGGEAMLGAVLCRRRRYDLKLDLAAPPVRAALEQAVVAAGPACAAALGRHATLFELGALVADDGAARQPVHPDTPWAAAPAVVTGFFALQDVRDATMGATCFLPRTHATRPRAYLDGQPSPWGAAAPPPPSSWGGFLERAPCALPLLRRGDGVLFDARVLHAGGANCSGTRRVLFYFSLQRRGAGGAWQGGGFNHPGTLLDALRGQYRLGRDARTLERCAASTDTLP